MILEKNCNFCKILKLPPGPPLRTGEEVDQKREVRRRWRWRWRRRSWARGGGKSGRVGEAESWIQRGRRGRREGRNERDSSCRNLGIKSKCEI